MSRLFNSFYRRLPVRRVRADDRLHLMTGEERRRVRRIRHATMAAAALLSVLGFLSYYLPLYQFPHLFPATEVTIPPLTTPVRVPWAELLWAVLLTTVELVLLTLLNIAGVHEIAVATGFINAETKAAKGDALLQVGLERKSRDVDRYGIDPFQGLNKWGLLLFNTVLRLKGWIGNQIIRYLVRLLLGRYAVRAVLDLSGMPLYMAINAYSVHAVLREAQVIIMGQTVVTLLRRRLPPDWEMSAAEKELLYDTLQYIAVSKRDFHQNHYFLTKELLEFFRVPSEPDHQLPDDYLDKLAGAPEQIRALCQMVILLGFILDGRLSTRERFRIAELNKQGVLQESYADVKRYLRAFVKGAGVDAWGEAYLDTFNRSPRLPLAAKGAR